MKIKLDECISNRVALAIMQVTANREGYEVSFVRHGHGGADPDWIRAFAAEGGTAIVSGDHDILQHWPNLIAYTESGLVSFFPPKAYQHLSGFGRAAFIVRWWPAIIEKIKISQKGDRWRIPMNWMQVDHTKMESLRDPRIDGIGPQPDPRKNPTSNPRKTASRSIKRPDDGEQSRAIIEKAHETGAECVTEAT